MLSIDTIQPQMCIRGIVPDAVVTVTAVTVHGDVAATVVYTKADGSVDNILLLAGETANIEIVDQGRPWSFDGDGAAFRLASEAHRITLAHLFDPVLAVHSSRVRPLPHQISAVYEHMLPRLPLRFLLADDPGAGKTIMAGLLIKELIIRGDLRRCLVVCPGNLAEQWQDELHQRFQLPFEILTNDGLQSARTGNWFLEHDLVIARLDKLSRDEEVQQKLAITECAWDLVVCDEAHKMAASFTGGEIKYTKRHRLGQLLGHNTRHLLLMTATPHNGKEEDFQLFMSLLDPDRFEGRFRTDAHAVDVSDLMRRMVKESLLTFEGTPLFPERRAYTVPYKLSPGEDDLYRSVTQYVRDEFNRAEKLQSEKRTNTVGFALTVLQRRLASSPEAIYQSLHRRRERLEKRLAELELGIPAKSDAAKSDAAKTDPAKPTPDILPGTLPLLTREDLDDFDEATDDEIATLEEQLLDQATAAQTKGELLAEIATLTDLEQRAARVRASGDDRKWTQLSNVLAEIFTAAAQPNRVGEPLAAYGTRVQYTPSAKQKLVIFTEHRDTLEYLRRKVTTMLGRHNAVEVIHGALNRAERRRAEESFKHDPDVQVLIATDAAGEGINLQRAHLMVNYDLPWNPNRLEQRFGRIHRIGQTEVCHLWNLVADETREGDVYNTLLRKLEQARLALGGQVFDVLGELQFEGRSLRDLLIEAIRYGEQPEVRARLTRSVADATAQNALRSLLEDRALATEVLDAARIRDIRDDMQRAEARRLQPAYVRDFFLEAFQRLGGTAHRREPGRWELTNVPATLRGRHRTGTAPVLRRYERIAFDKQHLGDEGGLPAAFICPGHPLLDAVLDLTLAQHRDLLRRGSILVDENDPDPRPRVLVTLEHTLRDGVEEQGGTPRDVSRRMMYVEVKEDGSLTPMRYAAYLDYKPLAEAARAAGLPGEAAADASADDVAALTARILAHPACGWIDHTVEARAISHAIAHIVPEHLAEVRGARVERVQKIRAAVRDRLVKEMNYWDKRWNELKLQEAAGRPAARLNSAEARRRADELNTRLTQRLAQLQREEKITPQPPVVLGGAVIVTPAFLDMLRTNGEAPRAAATMPMDTQTSALRAREVVMAVERGLGNEPVDREYEKLGYDIESRDGTTGVLRYIEVKGRVSGADDITVTHNEMLFAEQNPDTYIFVIVEFHDETCHSVHYIRRPFGRGPDFGETSRRYGFADLLHRREDPS